MRFTSILSLAAAAALLAGCASTPSGPPGKYLVYRDFSGKPTRQFDYPSDDSCKRVEAIAGGARCQPQSASADMPAQAKLLYNPPGFEVLAHYATLDRCRAETSALGAGVQLLAACAAK